MLTRRVAHGEKDGEKDDAPEAALGARSQQRWLLILIPILRALAIVFVVFVTMNLWLKITPRLHQGPGEVLHNLLPELVVGPSFFANSLSVLARYFTTRSKVESSQLQCKSLVATPS